MIAYYFGFTTQLDIEDDVPDNKTAIARLDFRTMKLISESQFVANLERLGLLYHYEVVETVSWDGFAEYQYLIKVQPHHTGTEFEIKLSTNAVALPMDCAELLKQKNHIGEWMVCI